MYAFANIGWKKRYKGNNFTDLIKGVEVIPLLISI